MKLRDNVKKGLFIFTIYLVAMIFVFMATDRVEQLDENYKNETTLALNLNK